MLIVELNTILAGSGKSVTGSLGLLLSLKSQSASSAIANTCRANFCPAARRSDSSRTRSAVFGLAVAVIISSFYLSLTEDGVERFIKVVIPPDYEPMALKIYGQSRRLIGSWFRTQLLLSLIMGVMVWVGLAIIGVPYAFLIGFIAAICELVPFVGPIISGAIGIVSALTVSTTLAVYTLIFFLIAQQFESNLLVPILSRRAVGLHPVIVIVALLIGAEIGGFLGVIIAVPVAAVFQEVIQDWSSRKRAEVAEAIDGFLSLTLAIFQCATFKAMETFYVTTPIYYVNDKPHIGHAYTTIVADVLARFRRTAGDDVMFVTGVDENSQKTVDAAAKNGEEIHAYLDRLAKIWESTWQKLGISNTDFIRTTEERHVATVNDFWARLEAAGDLYRGKYEGLVLQGARGVHERGRADAGWVVSGS